MEAMLSGVRYPRRRAVRKVLHWLAYGALSVLTRLEFQGRENWPKQGPLLVVANHFSFIDPALMVGLAPWPLEFIGGFRMPNAPPIVTWIPKVWGYLPVFRGTGSRGALRVAERILSQGGILGVYPEATSRETFLRPARPGAAYLATRTGAPLLPVGVDGLPQVFPSLRDGHRAHVMVRIGEPFGPFEVSGRGRDRRQQLDEIGHEIMRRIAQLISPAQRGYYSDDPALRAAAEREHVYMGYEGDEPD
jgi:1-acyl-sn-glycerol-3-phosphate acyltransferase